MTTIAELSTRAERAPVRDTVLVVGGSGFVGRHLVPHLAARGSRVRVLARNTRRAEAEGWQGVEILRGDATDRASLVPALAGVDIVYYLVHSMTAGKRFPDLDRTAAETFASAAREAGVRRIVYLGGLAPRDVDTVHLASRVETGAMLRRNHPDVVELRAGIIIGPGSAAFEVMRDLVANLPVMLTPRWVRSLSPPIALDDLLVQLEALATLDGVAGAVIETAGPDRLSYEEMMVRLADVLGKRRPLIIRVPLLTPELSAYWIEFVTSTPAPIARALITGLKHDLSATKDPRLEAVAPARIGFDEAVRRALARERERLSDGRWREGAFDLRGMRHEVAYYGVAMRRARASTASAEALWRSLERFGTADGGALSLRALWAMRRTIERAFGGEIAPPREPGPFRPGQRFDVWRVHGVFPPASLVLLSTLRAPGAGGFEFGIEEEGGRRVVSATIHWHPRGFWGLMYWYALALFHHLVLASLTAAIVREAERTG